MSLPPGGIWVHKFGYNWDVDTATDPEDCWSAGGTYPFPSAAAATTIISDSAEDDPDKGGAVAGTGAFTVKVFGTDTNGAALSETVSLNGTAAVTLAGEYLRVFRAYVVTSGTGASNAGTILVKHGATVIAQIPKAATSPPGGGGQTEMAIYTIPTDYAYAYLTSWKVRSGDISKNTNVTCLLETNENGAGWRTRAVGAFSQVQKGDGDDWPLGMRLAPQTDIRIRVQIVSADNTAVVGRFDLVQFA